MLRLPFLRSRWRLLCLFVLMLPGLAHAVVPHDFLSTPRYQHTTTLLPNGKLLIVGGRSDQYSGDGLASAELFDPASSSFTPAGSMNQARNRHTATLLPDGRVLLMGGQHGNPQSSAEFYNPTTGRFIFAGSMQVRRESHTATLLANGKVLITGGFGLLNGSGAFLASAELYDPATGTSALTGSMGSTRYGHTATLLPNGKVLVTGGRHSNAGSSSAELYDPVTGTFTPTGSMREARRDHTATLLPNGNVLITGGWHTTSNSISGAELYNPITGVFTPIGSMGTARRSHTATLLANGEVLITGGHAGVLPGLLSSSEIYNPATGLFTPAGSMGAARFFHSATLLPNGHVFIAAGSHGDMNSGSSASGELYDPTTGQFTLLGPFQPTKQALNLARAGHTATLLDSGQVLIAGGFRNGALAKAELYNPITNTFVVTGEMATKRHTHTATLLNNGLVLIAGGYGDEDYILSSAELYDPTTASFISTGEMNSARAQHHAILLSDGKVLITGGGNSDGILASAEIYDPDTGVFTPTGAMSVGRVAFTSTLLFDGTVLIAGGISPPQEFLASAELYDPATESFTSIGSMGTARYNHTATRLLNGKILIAGGANPNTAFSTTELYDPTSGSFTPSGSMTAPRNHHSATLLPTGKILVAGGGQAYDRYASTETYDPATGSFTSSGSLGTARAEHTAILLLNGKILIAAGSGAQVGMLEQTNLAELYSTPPDLKINAIMVPGGSLFAGDDVPVTLTVQNRGATDADDFRLDVYKHLATAPGQAQPGDAHCPISGLAAGMFTSCSLNLAYANAGTYSLWVQIDTLDQVNEAIEINNTNGPVSITLTLPTADLVIDNLTVAPTNPRIGQAATVTITLRNQGTGDTGPFRADIYKNLAASPATGQTGDANCTIAGLAAGATTLCSVTVVYSAAGSATLWARADTLNQVKESSEGNNTRSANVIVVAPDLIISSVSNPPATSPIAGSFTVTDITRNQGTAATGVSTINRYYLSLDTVKNSNDKLLSGKHGVVSLAAGAGATGTVKLTVPSGVTAGSYYLLACADDTAKVTEGNEANNCTSSAGQIQIVLPDLIESTVAEPPAIIDLGASFTISDTVSNQGLALSAASTTRYYLSLDPVRSSTDKLVASRSVAMIAAGGNGSGSATATIPTNLAAGNYYLIACADDLKKVAESDETNNCSSSSTFMRVVLPDLMVINLSATPASAALGGSFEISGDTVNQGEGNAAASTTSYYLSRDKVKSNGDILVGNRAVAALAAGDVSSGDATLTIPSTTATGDYYVIACADNAKAIKESTENNNCRASAAVVKIMP